MSRCWHPLVAAGLLVGCATVEAGPSNPFDRLSDAERNQARTTRTQALESGASGTSFSWAGSAPGSGGTITVLTTLQRADGTFCRRFREMVRAGADSDSFQAVFCRTPAGEWLPEIDRTEIVTTNSR
jgi:surface antigen